MYIIVKGEWKLRRIFLVMVAIFFLVVLIGCFIVLFISNKTNEKQTSIINKSNESKGEFSYIDGLPDERLNEYELFVNDNNTVHLKEFSPEQVVLVYMHSIVIGDINSIYAITYDDGKLPDLDAFKNEYRENMQNSNLDMVLNYRYYNTIETTDKSSGIKIDDLSETKKAVIMKVSIGSFTSMVLQVLQKENDIWKMDIYDLMKEVGKKNSPIIY